jgi:imidazolonepropionase-like amidohydrolase
MSFDHYRGPILAQQNRPLVERAATAGPILGARLRAGMTTIRIPGEREWLSTTLKKLVSEGALPGPDIVEAGLAMKASSGHGVVPHPTDGTDAILRTVRENASRGADFIKIFLTGSVTNITNPNLCYYSKNEIKTALDEAHHLGRRVTSHAYGGQGVDWGLEFGLDTVEHGILLTPEQINRMAKQKTMLVLTLGAYFNEEAAQFGYPKDFLPKIAAVREQATRAALLAKEAGITIALGCDDSGPRMTVIGEIERVVSLGFSPTEALLMATRNAAEVCGLSQSQGSIEAGKAANIVGIVGDPLQDIRLIREISFVMKRGEVIKHTPKL